MKNKSNLRWILFLCIPLYLSQGIIIPSGIIPQLLLVVWLLIDFYYLLVYLSKGEKDSLSNIIILFWGLNAISWVISPKMVYSAGDSIRTLDHFKNITIALLTYFPFCHWIKTRQVSEKYLKTFAFVMYIIAVIMFRHYHDVMILQKGLEGVTNNNSYIFVTLFPLLYLFRKNKIFWYFLLLSTLFFVLLGAKRGAIICLLVQLLIFVRYSSNSRKSSIKKWLIPLLLLVSIGFVTYRLLQGNDYLLQRISNMEEGKDASGDVRIFLYTYIWEYFRNAPFISKIFGLGFNQTIALTGGYYAHNDWLEILTNQGVIGIFLYFILLMRIFTIIRNEDGGENWRRCMLLMVFAPWIIRSVVSMGYVSMETFYFMIVIAYARFSNRVMTKR